MINPFSDFENFAPADREIPLDRILKVKDNTMDQISAGYLKIMEDEVKDLVWLVEHSRVVKAYSAALDIIKNLEYGTDDIEDFCQELDRGERLPYLISGPAGIYVSALCNTVKEDNIRLRLYELKRSFHFLGYRLPEGKTLELQGSAGDFTGTGLCGGKLVVEGSAGNWTGAGAMKGTLFVKDDTGQNTGEWMKGGEIHVGGHIVGLGKSISGGRIFQREKLVFPKQSESGS